MSLALDRKLKIRAMVYVAGEPIPYFWPMRNFIHHNPLHGLEKLPFAQAVEKGQALFHGKGFLPRKTYQRFLQEGKIDRASLLKGVQDFVTTRSSVPGVDLSHWLMTLLTQVAEPLSKACVMAGTRDVHHALNGMVSERAEPVDMAALAAWLHEKVDGARPIYEAVDTLFGTHIGTTLDDLLIKSCLDFFDEGQSAWTMPGRESGLFNAWRELSRRNVRLFLRGVNISQILAQSTTPEGVIAYAMDTLAVPEARWADYFSRELVHLHGWAGFIRWRSNAKHYYWGQHYPADLVDFLAVRLALGLALLKEEAGSKVPGSAPELAQFIDAHTAEAFLRYEFYSGNVVPQLAAKVEDAILRGKQSVISSVFTAYVEHKRVDEAMLLAQRLQDWGTQASAPLCLTSLSIEELDSLLATVQAFEQTEGMLWLRAMEARAMRVLLRDVDVAQPALRDKRPFAQALFCIDTRSERIRRQLEHIGDYQTYGIAGFFGVPIGILELGKGSETHLCPAVVTPKNLVLEMNASGPVDESVVGVFEHALHELKNSVLAPFAAVEAIGLLFGFDMIGKTIVPLAYSRWRRKLFPAKQMSRLLLDKLGREQADSILRAVQRAVIVKAVEHELGLPPERITDDLVRQLRETALTNQSPSDELAHQLGLDLAACNAFVTRLRDAYRINRRFSRLQFERLGRIGFSSNEQAHLVGQALRSIGLVEHFSRFVLLVGHGSTSENNPYESALDCGACGGNSGIFNARAMAQMANKSEVRRRLREQGLDIPADVHFVAALHNTTTDEITILDRELIPPAHLIYLDRLHKGLKAASRLCAQERMATLVPSDTGAPPDANASSRLARRNANDWSQARPEWGLSRNAYFVIGRRQLTQRAVLAGRAFLNSYDWRVDPKRRLLESILTGPLVVGQWINMEHYFSTVDNERYGSGNKAYHNVAGRFGVMTGNLSDLRTGLPAQTVLKDGHPYHEPLRLITLIEAPFEHARSAIEGVVTIKRLVQNDWIRMLVLDPETLAVHLYNHGAWQQVDLPDAFVLEPTGSE
ncbi:DUF2309 domain-containing protein [Sulfuriferula sp. GW1]|uniref:DUF2309 domain-containing protein n=1 Tax=Sulfuriferula sp. GW1 TaxID=3345111 RepID=UPI0039B01AB7